VSTPILVYCALNYDWWIQFLQHLIHTCWLQNGAVNGHVVHAGDEMGHVSLLLSALPQLLLLLHWAMEITLHPHTVLLP